jgi:hypothetical protein
MYPPSLLLILSLRFPSFSPWKVENGGLCKVKRVEKVRFEYQGFFDRLLLNSIV